MTEQPRDLRDDGELVPDAELMPDDARSAADDVDPDKDALLGDDADFIRRWDQAQATFVDDPRRAVSDAAALVEDVLARLSDTFSAERERAEATHRTARRRRTCGSRCSSIASSSDGCWPPDEFAYRRGAHPTGRMSRVG